jgi:hypothetical protein
MVMLKECKTNESRNKLQQLQWKKQGNEEDNVNDGGTKLKRTAMGIKNRQEIDIFGNGGRLCWKPMSTTECSA